MKVFLALILYACLAQLPLARSAQDCPDVRASQVAAAISDLGGGSNQCSIGISIFGFEISIHFGECPMHQAITPAHQTCNGASSPGNMCVSSGMLEVTLLKCQCNFFGGKVIGLHWPGCDCEDLGNGGTVEDFKTTPCFQQA